MSGLWRFKGYKGCNGEELGANCTQCQLDDWLLTQSPLTAHTNLLDHGLIPDPFKGCNEREVQWVSENEWWYRKEIDLTLELVNKESLELFFGGLDTFATIWVNDVKVGEANNMFIPWRFNIKDIAKAGKNLIAIRFKPVCKVARELEQRHKQKYACLSAENFSARPYVRKAQYSFGWDWGPTLPTTGIWREAKILAFDKARLGYVTASPLTVSKEEAKVRVSAEINASGKHCLNVKFILKGFGQKYEALTTIEVSEGRNFADCIIDVSCPELWWPKGYGKPALYDATVHIYSEAEMLDSKTFKVGIRSIKLVEEPDDEGKTFVFQINGQNVFCKGANWIPADSFLPRVNFNRYKNLLTYAADANFNMLRVWGGGVYEAEEFYDLCDSLGIMVWQDFMYVCAGYPEEEWFLREAEHEAMEAILRLRHHPSIVVWCGNNENQWLHSVLWKARDNVDRLYGATIYESLLARICQSLDPTRPYRPSSPFGGLDSSGRHEGDRHNWEVWSQGYDYPAYLNDNARFISEFGWQAPPTMDLLAAYLEKQDLTTDSYAFRAHEKQTGGLELLRALLAIHYPIPQDLALFVMYSQLNQGEALKTAITHWRGRMFKTSGCLIWQLNDCWPSISWSLIDYGLNPKAAYYFVKRAYQPIIVPLILKQDKLEIYVINETRTDLQGSMNFQVVSFNGEILFSQALEIFIPAYTSKLAMTFRIDEIPYRADCVYFSELRSGKEVLADDTRTIVEPKVLILPDPKIQLKIKKLSNRNFEIEIYSQSFAKAIQLDLKGIKSLFSDNFFDLLSGKKKIVQCKVEEEISLEQFQKVLCHQFYPYTMI